MTSSPACRTSAARDDLRTLDRGAESPVLTGMGDAGLEPATSALSRRRQVRKGAQRSAGQHRKSPQAPRIELRALDHPCAPLTTGMPHHGRTRHRPVGEDGEFVWLDDGTRMGT